MVGGGEGTTDQPDKRQEIHGIHAHVHVHVHVYNYMYMYYIKVS